MSSTNFFKYHFGPFYLKHTVIVTFPTYPTVVLFFFLSKHLQSRVKIHPGNGVDLKPSEEFELLYRIKLSRLLTIYNLF
nr:hypothetical protein [Dinophyceae sp. MRD-151]